MVLLSDQHRKELSGGFANTTNNRMEVLAAVVGLEALKKPSTVTLYSDSKYLVDAMMQGWAKKWQAKGWMRNKKEKAVNPDLWERLLDLTKQHDVEFRWVRGHAGVKENERCDTLATQAASGNNLPEDTGYIAKPSTGGIGQQAQPQPDESLWRDARTGGCWRQYGQYRLILKQSRKSRDWRGAIYDEDGAVQREWSDWGSDLDAAQRGLEYEAELLVHRNAYADEYDERLHQISQGI